MGIKINQIKKLTSKERALLVSEIYKLSTIIFIGPRTWNRLERLYRINIDDRFAGVCGVNTFQNWVKIGPIVILSKYRNKGIGTALIKYVIKHEKSNNLFIGSPNPAVWKIATKSDFKEYKSSFSVPWKVWIIYLKMSWYVVQSRETMPFFNELFRKKKIFAKRNKLKHFYLKKANTR